MSTHVALLKAVNLVNHNRVTTPELCGLFESVGLREPRGLLASGNVLFTSKTADSQTLAEKLGRAAEKQLGLRTTFFVRSAPDWRGVVEGNPFTDQAKQNPGHLIVLTLAAAPSRDAASALTKAIAGREIVYVHGRTAYAVYPDGAGNSKLTTALIERKLGTLCTGRNWNTVLKIAALLS